MPAFVLLMLLATPLHAFEIFGFKFFEQEAEEETIGTPQDYELDFQVAGDDGEVEEALKGTSILWRDRDKPASGPAGLVAMARGEYRRLLDALYAKARYAGTITITIDGREAAQLRPDAEFANPARVVVTVQPGPVFAFGQANIVNQAPPATAEDDVVTDPAAAGFTEGAVAPSTTILKAGRLAVEAWREQGHAEAAIAGKRVVAEHTTDRIDAEITVSPGPKAFYGPVAVEGTKRMDPAFVAWMAGLEPGKEYDPDDLEKARKRLSRLDVFRTVIVEGEGPIRAGGQLPMGITVQERLARTFGVGGSYSTTEGFGPEAFWVHRNLFGHAERLRLDAEMTGLGETIDPQDLTYHVGATFTRPGFLTRDTSFVASLAGDREVLDVYKRTGITGAVGLRHIFGDELSGRIFLEASQGHFEDDAFGKRDFTTLGLAGALTYDGRDSEINATEGFYLEGAVEPFYEFVRGNTALKLTAEGRAYAGLGAEDRVVLAGRLKIGSITGPSIADLPPDKLYLAGGGGSVRGYGYRTIGVETFGVTTGGRSLIEGSAELRVRATDRIGVVGFIDAAQVGAEPWPEVGDDLRIGAGAGIRYDTGFGPIRLDVGVPLDKRTGDPDFAVYVGIGQAF